MSPSEYPWLKFYPDRPRWDMELEPRWMVDALGDSATKHPTRPAMDFMGKIYTYHKLYNLVGRFAKGLQTLSVQKGDKVGLCLPNCPLYPIAYYGALMAGAVVVNFNPLYAERELEHLIEDSECDIIVTLDLKLMMGKLEKALASTRLEKLIIGRFADFLPFPKNALFPLIKAGEIASINNDARFIKLHELLKNDGKAVRPEIDLVNDVAVLQYTGGTTGVPKGAMLTHANISINAVQCYAHFPDPPTDEPHEKMLAALPFFSCFCDDGVPEHGGDSRNENRHLAAL